MFFFGSKLVVWMKQWRREVAFAGFDVAIQMDISAEKMLFGVSGVDPQRRAELIKVCQRFIHLPSFLYFSYNLYGSHSY